MQKIAQIAKTTSFWSYRNSCVFWHAKKTQKNTKKDDIVHLLAECAGRRGGLEGCICPAKVCMQRNICKEYMRKNICGRIYAEFWLASSTPRRVRRIASRIPPGQVERDKLSRKYQRPDQTRDQTSPDTRPETRPDQTRPDQRPDHTRPHQTISD